MRKIEIVSSTTKTLCQFYGNVPRTQKSFTVLSDGEPIAVVGLFKDKDRMVAFSESKIDPRHHISTVGHCMKRLKKMIQESRLPVHALSDNAKLLERMGFKDVGGYYVWPR